MRFGICLAALAFIGASASASGEDAAMGWNNNIRKLQVASTSSVPVEAISAQQATIYGSASVAPSANFKSGWGWALSGFAVSFKNGDHKLNSIGVQAGQVDGMVKFTFRDQNTDDPFNAESFWYQSPGFSTGSVAGVGSGEFNLPIATRAGYTPVLAGFQFKRADGHDANLRTIAIRLTPDRKHFRVMLLDNQGLDFRGLETAVAAGFSMLGVDPLMATGVVVGPGAILTTRVADIDPKTKLRQYAVEVQYSLVPDIQIAAAGKLSGSTSAYESGRKPNSGEKIALQGFLFHFQDSDHHILQIGIEPERINASGRNNPVFFCDGDCVRKKIQWQSDYVVLK